MILYGADQDVCEWVSSHIFGETGGFDDKSTAIGIIENNCIIAGVVYNNYQPNLLIEMSIASVDKRWCNRHNLRAFFKYPFIDLAVKRVQTLCSANDEGVIMFNKRIGFTQEGLHRSAWHTGENACSFGMLKNECRWING